MTAQVEPRLLTLAAPLHAPSAAGPSAFYSHLQQELARILATCGGDKAAAISTYATSHHDAAVPGHEVGVACNRLQLGFSVTVTFTRQPEAGLDVC